MESHDEKIYMLIVEGQREEANADHYFEQAIELIERHYVKRIILNFSNRLPVDETEGIARETLVAVYYGLPTYSGDATTLKSWIRKIAHNKATDYHRDRNRSDTSEELWEQIKISRESTPESMLVEADETQRKNALIDCALPKLPFRYQVVIKLRRLEKLTPKEIAWVLDASVDYVRTLHVRATKKLREEVEKLEREG